MRSDEKVYHEVREALKRMSSGKVAGPDNIPIEVWKSLSD